LHIASNSGEEPFEIVLIGTGLGTPGNVRLAITSITRDADGVTRVTIYAQAGRVYVFEISEDLRNWTAVETVTPTEEGMLEFTGLASELPQLFYRVKRN
jgi:hypothetical protein